MTMSSTNPKRDFHPGNGTGRGWRSIVLMAGLFGLVLFGLIALAAATGWEETLTHIADLGLVQLAILLVHQAGEPGNQPGVSRWLKFRGPVQGLGGVI